MISDAGDDWTAPMLQAASKMKSVALARNVQLALLMDIRAACGSTTIYAGPRSLRSTKKARGAPPPR